LFKTHSLFFQNTYASKDGGDDEDNEDDEDDTWLETILMIIADKPPRSWRDDDVLLFETKLSDLAIRFRNLERKIRSTSTIWAFIFSTRIAWMRP